MFSFAVQVRHNRLLHCCSRMSQIERFDIEYARVNATCFESFAFTSEDDADDDETDNAATSDAVK
jgi:hypothetical protein